MASPLGGIPARAAVIRIEAHIRPGGRPGSGSGAGRSEDRLCSDREGERSTNLMDADGLLGDRGRLLGGRERRRPQQLDALGLLRDLPQAIHVGRP